ncbi:2'-5' RNA ligase family protein [soil metagenome]
MTAVDAQATASESAIIVPVEVPIAVRRLRDRMDPSAAVAVPAHITLLYPFMPVAQLDDGVVQRVRGIVAAEASFPFVFRRHERWPDVVYLPPEPDAPFRRLIEALAAEFPDYPPYGGAHPEVVPHLTVAHAVPEDYLAAAEHALPQMLPIRDVAREALLIAPLNGGPWSTLWRMPLSVARER